MCSPFFIFSYILTAFYTYSFYSLDIHWIRCYFGRFVHVLSLDAFLLLPSAFPPFFAVSLFIMAPAQCPHRNDWNYWFYSKQKGRTRGRGGVDGLRSPRQVAGSPASEPAVGVCPPRGAKLPARLPQPHLGQGDRQGRAEGSAPVHPALSPTHLIMSSFPVDPATLLTSSHCSNHFSFLMVPGAGRASVFWSTELKGDQRWRSASINSRKSQLYVSSDFLTEYFLFICIVAIQVSIRDDKTSQQSQSQSAGVSWKLSWGKSAVLNRDGIYDCFDVKMI